MSPIEWPDMEAFFSLSGVRFAPWEVELVELIDDLFISEQSRKIAK